MPRKLMIACCSLLVLASLSVGVPVPGPDDTDVTADVDCQEIGRLNGQVQYQYDVTLKNNTERKLIVEYTVIFLAGSVRKKEFKHSTLLIPEESTVESHDGAIKENDWDNVTRFRIEWESRDSKQEGSDDDARSAARRRR